MAIRCDALGEPLQRVLLALVLLYFYDWERPPVDLLRGGSLHVDVHMSDKPLAQVGVQVVLDPMRELRWAAEDQMVKRLVLKTREQQLAGSPDVVLDLLLDAALNTRL